MIYRVEEWSSPTHYKYIFVSIRICRIYVNGSTYSAKYPDGPQNNVKYVPDPDGPAPISVLFSGFYNIKGVRKEVESIKSSTKTDKIQEQRIDLWSLYIFAVKSPITRQKYQKRLVKFLDFISLDKADKTIEQKALVFAESGRKDPNCAFSSIVKFVQFQRDRVNKKEITGGISLRHLSSFAISRVFLP